ncbi:hypothetical protein GCM10009801_19790 [Streptomyces albiaxialis]|uniref:Secreted protein n=1 Tax=Streptomyces albiaxialis TaxID=329523 RepID=A0ABN2VQT6_9ACTN
MQKSSAPRRSSAPRSVAAAVACVAVLGLLGTACSDSSGEKDTKDSAAQGGGKTEEDQAVAWRKCLRDNGVDMPEPKSGEEQAGITVDRKNQGAMKKAIDACKDKAPKNGPGSPLTQKEKDELVARAKCLRKHGVDVPVPKEGQAAALPMPKTAAEKKKLEKAHKACGSEIR